MVKVERSFPAPESLAEEAKKVGGRYDKQDVIDRLKKDFHNKCYICGLKELQDPNVEHLLIRTGSIQRENLTGKIYSGHAGIAMV